MQVALHLTHDWRFVKSKMLDEKILIKIVYDLLQVVLRAYTYQQTAVKHQQESIGLQITQRSAVVDSRQDVSLFCQNLWPLIL